MSLRISFSIYILLIIILFTLFSCRRKLQEVPTQFREFIPRNSVAVKYREILPYYDQDKPAMPAFLTKTQALEDINMLEYLLNTSYAGYEYWQHKGVDFKSFFTDMRTFVDQSDSVSTYDFERALSRLLKLFYDGHIALIGAGYNHAYKHKAVYYCDVLVEKTVDGRLKVIDSQNDRIQIGDIFTQNDSEKFLFRTLSPPGKVHYLIGVLSFDAVTSCKLSFNNTISRIPFHKSRLLFVRFDDPEPFYIERKNNIPVVRVTSFENELYPEMKKFIQFGKELKKENTILLNLYNNGGGSSVFPQHFISNLNGISDWNIVSAVLNSPATTQYYAGYDLASMINISPEFRYLIQTNRQRMTAYRLAPAKNWEFHTEQRQSNQGYYDGALVILTNRRVLSAGESMVGYSQTIKKRIVIGENTGGVAQFSDGCQYYLPNSKFIAKIPRQLLLIPDLEECVGFLPDYWLDSMEPMEEILHWLEDPEQYRFTYACPFNDFQKNNNFTSVLPDNIKIIPPSLRIPDKIRAFSGKWFGVSDGILDHLLVVEKINEDLSVQAVYAWGVAYQWNIFQPGWRRFNGKFEGQKLILSGEPNKMKITYQFSSDSTLEALYERPGVLSYTQLSQLETSKF